MDALELLKKLVGADDTQDDLLKFLLEDTGNAIMGYCRIDSIPSKLESLVPIIAADMYRAKGYGKEAAPADVQSISEGSRSVSYENHRPDNEVLKSYYKRLDPFKNRKGRVPSDVKPV